MQGTATLDQEQGGLVLGLGTEIIDAEGPGDHVPGEGHELVGPGGGTGVAGRAHDAVGMALEGVEQAAAEEDPVADLMAVGPGALGVADRVQEGATLGGDGEDPGRGRQGCEHRDPRGGRRSGDAGPPGLGALGGPGRPGQAQTQSGEGEKQGGALKVRQEERS